MIEDRYVTPTTNSERSGNVAQTARPGKAGYRDLLQLHTALAAFGGSLVARLAFAMLPVSLLITVSRLNSSFAAGGLAVGVFAIMSVFMPVKARLVDRVGTRRAVPSLALGFAIAVLAMAVVAHGEVRHPYAYILLAALAGLAAPPIGPTMRAVWADATPNPDVRQRAYGLDAAAEEAVYVVGPAVAVLLTSSLGAPTALTVAAAATAIGGLLIAAAVRAADDSAAPTDPGVAIDRRGPLRATGFPALVLLMLVVGLATSPIDLVVIARTDATTGSLNAGWALAIIALAGAVGGIVWGHWEHRRGPAAQLSVLLGVVAAALAGTAFISSVPLLTAGLAVAGLVVAPIVIICYLTADQIVPDGTRVEALTWVSTANNAGIALGAAITGIVIDKSGPKLALVLGGAVLATAYALLPKGRLAWKSADVVDGELASSSVTG